MRMPVITEISAIPTIHAFHELRVHPVGFESDFGYHDPTKMKNTAAMFAMVPTMPLRYRTHKGARRSRSNTSGFARFAKKMSRTSNAVEMNKPIVTPTYRA